MTKITPKQGEHYYQKENYYTLGDALKHSEWFGRGATALGLSDYVQNEDFANLLHGKSPDGSQELSGKKINPSTHRAGVDLTFSAPKSLSIAALVGGDQRLTEAHRRAVQRALEVAEQRFAQTRITVDGTRQAIITGNLVVAQFHHDTSRLKDPQLHTHCVVLNMTQMESGQWRSQNYGLMYNSKMFLGQLYRNELACEVHSLGYEIERKDDGLFEIKGYTQEQLEAFSKRSQQIKALVASDASSKEKERAALKNRPLKANEIPFYQQKYQWELQAESLGLRHPKALQPNEILATSAQNANKAVSAGIEHCSERDVAFRRSEVEQFVMSEVGRCDWLQLQSAIDNNSQLLRATNGRYTTQSALDREHDTIQLVWQGQSAVTAITHPEAVHQHLEKTTLNEGQRAAVMMAATTKDQFTALVGVAGAGKSRTLQELKAIAEAQGYKFKGFAASAQAANVLGEDVGIEAQTVASLLGSKQPERPEPNQFWAVDEAGLLSAKDVHALLQRATSERARVILVGDPRQLSAVDAGNPLKSLLQAEIQTAYLNKSRRQATEDLKEAVDLIADGHIAQGIKRLEQGHPEKGSRIEIVSGRDERASRITADYMALSPAERKHTLILAGTNEERLAITECIRKALKAEGTLRNEAQLTQLKAKDLTSVQMRSAHHFKAGDVVMPLRDYKRLGLEKGGLYAVTAFDEGSITLSASDGSTKTVDPAKFKKAVFERKEIEIASGDRLRWTKNNRDLKRTNGQQFIVRKINEDSAQIEYSSGKTESINLREAQHLDHALVSTTYSSQGQTANRVIAAVSNDPTFSKESFYVTVSRAKYDLKIYAESEKCLDKRAQESRAKSNPLEVVLEQQKQAKIALKESLASLRNSAITKSDSLKIKANIVSTLQVLEQQQSRGLHL